MADEEAPHATNYQRMREGIRTWVSDAADRAGGSLARLEPAGIVAFLCASAFGGVVADAAGWGGAPGTAVAGGFTAIGTGYLAEVLSAKAEQLRRRRGRQGSEADVRDELAGELRRTLESDAPGADALRADIARILREIGAVEVALSAAVRTANGDIVAQFWAALENLGGTFGEFGWALDEMRESTSLILTHLNDQGNAQRLVIDRLGLVEDLLRELAARPERIVGTQLEDDGGRHDTKERGDSPYRGLPSFREQDANVFFGREHLTATLVSRLARRVSTGGPLLVTGASGAGKSSLLCAGLMPALARGSLAIPGSADWPRMVMTPTEQPLSELATRVAVLTGVDAAQIRGSLAADPSRFDLTARQAVLAAGADGGRLVIVVDQFEQVFGPGCDERERQAFITALHAAATRHWGAAAAPALVVLGVRGDFLFRCADYEQLAHAIGEAELVVTPMSEEELRRVITEPAKAVGVGVESDLVDLLLRELSGAAPGGVRGAGVLPLLSHALAETWDRRNEGPLTIAAYASTGGIAQAVAASAQEVYDSLSPAEQRTAREIFSRLIDVDDAIEVSSPVNQAELCADRSALAARTVADVLERFGQRRLIILDDETVQIAHDALLRSWPLLHDWLRDDRARLAASARLRNSAREWDDHGRDRSYLYVGSRLALARVMADDPHPMTGELDRAFLRGSVRASQRRKFRLYAIASTVLLVVAATAGAALTQWRIALHQRDRATSGELAAESQGLIGTNPVVSRLLAVAAWRIDPTPQTRFAMINAAAQPAIADLSGDGDRVGSIAFSPDGQILAIGSDNGRVQLWNVNTHQPIGAPFNIGKTGQRDWVAFSPDGRTLAAGAGGTVRLWATATRRLIGAHLMGNRASVHQVAFSPDGRTLAVAAGFVRLWNSATGRLIATLPARGDAFTLAFSPDGRILAAGGRGIVWLWDVATRRQMGMFTNNAGADLGSLAFSPNGNMLASGSNYATVVWNVANHREIGAPLITSGIADSVAFNPEGTLAIGSNGTVQLRDVTADRQIGVLAGEGPVYSLAFSPDGRILATGGDHGMVRLWDVVGGRQIGGSLEGSADGPAYVVTFSPAGSILATGGLDGWVRVWHAATHRMIGAHSIRRGASIESVAFSPDGRTLAAVGDECGQERTWSTTTGRPLTVHETTIGPGPPASVMFLSDDQVLCLAGETGALSLATRTVAVIPNWHLDELPLALIPSKIPLQPIRLWDYVRHRYFATFPTPRAAGPTDSVALTADGRILAAGSHDGTVRLWDVATRRQIGPPLAGSVGPVYSLAFAPDGRTLAAGGDDGTVRLWDVATRRQIGPPLTTNDPEPIYSVAFSPNGRVLATAGNDGTARLWDVAYIADLPTTLCASAGRSLTPTEWRHYAPGLPYQQVCPN